MCLRKEGVSEGDVPHKLDYFVFLQPVCNLVKLLSTTSEKAMSQTLFFMPV